ncbi:MAG: Alanine--tRNA ligase, partial [Planctomycetota bacterium]
MTETSPTSDPRWSAERVRADFLEFFRARGHAIVPSGPVFPQDDPTLLFTNAGMNQFKDVFLGTGQRDYKRAADTQKCIRVSGKHNDLEEVGVDTYHHTFFEMLGNWSFGDYFKEDAICWSWELLTKVWGIPEERLWVTVFGGDKEDGLPADDEAERIWIQKAGIKPERVLRFGRKANFWEMGDTGPCGPCTEIHIDRGGPETNPADGADPKIGVNAGNERFMELWNNVFMQFNRLDDGRLQELPAKSVDTGMGFERVLSVLQKKRSNYDTDLFQPIFRRVEQLTGLKYEGGDSKKDVAFRVIADHVRALTAAFSDGALPSNEGRGYVLRRLLRRASRFGRQHLKKEDPFLYEVVPTVAQILGGVFPEMRARVEHVQALVKSEEESFGRTLGRGLVLFESLAQKLAAARQTTIAGGEAYELYATYGFPQDLVELMARERGLAVDLAGWDKAQKAHQEASKAEGKFKQVLSAEALASVKPTTSTCHAEGNAALEAAATVVLLERSGEAWAMVLDQSPFYAEGGGQCGDTGVVAAKDGSFRFEVRDTRRTGSVIVHLGDFRSGKATVGAAVVATVDARQRELTQKNHTATHLLHKALKEVLGSHVSQQGSYVGPDRLRFDFSHTKAVTAEEIERIEAIVNERIALNAGVKTTIEELESAKARGVVAMFGEKYEAKVRVLDVGGWSMELCGGTHVRAAGDIGAFLVKEERAIQAGVRRIEALTGPTAVAEIQAQRRVLREAAAQLKSAPEDIGARIALVLAAAKESEKKAAAAAKGDLGKYWSEVQAAFVELGGAKVAVLDMPSANGDAVRELAEKAKAAHGQVLMALFGREEGRVPFVVVCQGVAGKNAGQIAKSLGPHLGGG